MKIVEENGVLTLWGEKYDRPYFEIRVTELTEYSVKFDVKTITGWNVKDAQGQPEPNLTEDYLSAYIKWDGCSHFWFGEVGENGDRDSYLRICGSEDFREHIRLMEFLYRRAEELVPRLACEDPWEETP